MSSKIKYKLTPIADNWYAFQVVSFDAPQNNFFTIKYRNYNNQEFEVFLQNNYDKNNKYLTDTSVRHSYNKYDGYFYRIDIRKIGSKPVIIELNKHQYKIFNHSLKTWVDHLNGNLPIDGYLGDDEYYINFKDLK